MLDNILRNLVVLGHASLQWSVKRHRPDSDSQYRSLPPGIIRLLVIREALRSC
jgi:hypothetical protein